MMEKMPKFHVLTLGELAKGVCVCHNVALPFTLKKGPLRRQKKNYMGTQNISPYQNIILKNML
jgi:hypothetical protein